MAAFLDLPDDILFLVLLQFISGSQIEELIKLDTVSNIKFLSELS